MKIRPVGAQLFHV